MDTLENLKRTLAEITAHFKVLTGITAGWNREVHFREALTPDGKPAFRARMKYDGSITVHIAYRNDRHLLGTLIHEVLHTASNGMDAANFGNIVAMKKALWRR